MSVHLRTAIGVGIGAATVATMLDSFNWAATLTIVVTTALVIGSLRWVLASDARTRRLKKIIRAVRRTP